ncbi:MAG: DNA double-strand break repair nuclease NurA [Candidatus Methanodesulfokora sp.]|jgi:NurA-like 5'-3' nuclease
MFQDIVEEALRVRDAILRFIDTESRVSIEGKWVRWSSTTKSSEEVVAKYGRITGCDGGSNSFPLGPGDVVFAISAATSTLCEEGVQKERTYQIGWIERFKLEERISAMRSALEMKHLLRSIKGGSKLLLMDGSLYSILEESSRFVGFLSRRRGEGTKLEFLPRELIRDFVERLRDELSSEINGERVFTGDPESRKMREKIAEEIVDRYLERGPERGRYDLLLLSLMERVENVMTMRKLLDLSSSSDAVLVAISKRSSGREVFRAGMPDMTIIDMRTRDEGYTKPEYQELRASPYFETIWDSPYTITVSYIRLERGSNPLRVEILGARDERFLREIMNDLRGISVRGYPYPLFMSHTLARIGSKDIKGVRELIRGYLHSGREMLNE